MRRNGMSMAEVLVALFLLALGTIAILTMFPLGMYRMGQALKDDRTAQCAQQADQWMRNYWRVNVVETANDPMVIGFSNPDLITPVPSRRGTPAVSTGPSYPLFVDPMGAVVSSWGSTNTPAHLYWAGGAGANSPFLARTNLFVLSSQPQNASWRACSMMDGFTFAQNGAPSTSIGAVERELRYNWLWILQRPDNTVPTTANMTVVVFDRRAFQYVQQNAEMVFATQFPAAAPFFTNPGTPANTIVMQPLTTTVQIPVGLGIPPVQKGGWLMDATFLPVGNPFVPAGMRHAIFYRVVSVTDNTATTGMTEIELQSPIRRMDGQTNVYPGSLMYFAGVSEVFERPKLTPYDF